jgi:hypothetical protein
MIELRTTERQLQVVELRLAGEDFDAIAERLDITRRTALSLFSRAVENRKADIAERVDELRAIQLERIETGIVALWPAYSRGDLGAVDRMTRLLDRQARLLGLDLKPPDVTVDASQNVIVLPAWGEQAPQPVDGEARELEAGETG